MLKLTVAALVLFIAFISTAAWLSSYLVVTKSLPQADAILVLSGGAEFEVRAEQAARSYHSGVAPKIFLTNDGMRGKWETGVERNIYFIERARRLLVKNSVPEDAIIEIPTVVAGTIDEAEAFFETPLTKDLNSVLIVTSAFHTRRSLWAFDTVARSRSSSIQFGIGSPPNEPRTPPDADWWLSSKGWSIVVSEYAKFAYYKIRY